MTARRLLPVAVLVLLAAPSGASAQITTICHATGDAAAPYQQLDVQPADTIEHLTHGDDLVPAPATGCPAQVVPEPTPDAYPIPDTVTPPAEPERERPRRPRRRRSAPRPEAAVLPATAQGGPLGATASLQGDTLPMTGSEVPLIVLMGAGFVLAGLGLRVQLRGAG